MRTFTSGAVRDDSADKPDYEGYLSPVVLQRFGAYMQQHSIQADGVQRASDNWQRGIPKEEYLKSAWRHFLAWWLAHRGETSREEVEDALCALLFNVQGYLHVLLTEPPPETRMPSGGLWGAWGAQRAGVSPRAVDRDVPRDAQAVGP